MASSAPWISFRVVGQQPETYLETGTEKGDRAILPEANLRSGSKDPGPRSYSWDLSRDGSRLAFTQSVDREGRIRILSLAGREARETYVKDWNYLRSLSWATDGKGLFVGRRPISGSTLLYVDLEGRSDVLWQQGELPGSPWTWGVPSPDGRHLALVGYTADTNVWMLENF
jgi:hypothetical protein